MSLRAIHNHQQLLKAFSRQSIPCRPLPNRIHSSKSSARNFATAVHQSNNLAISNEISWADNTPPYAVLGHNNQAPWDEIKRSYYLLSMKYHPDLNSSADAGAKFIHLSNAYAVLGMIRPKEKFLSSPKIKVMSKEEKRKAAKEAEGRLAHARRLEKKEESLRPGVENEGRIAKAEKSKYERTRKWRLENIAEAVTQRAKALQEMANITEPEPVGYVDWEKLLEMQRLESSRKKVVPKKLRSLLKGKRKMAPVSE